MKLRTLILSVGLLPSLALAQGHKGKVYVDSNNNGTFDSGEKALSGVMVTDGLNITKTDKNGNFSIEGHDKERFIYITTPDGYKTNNAFYHRVSDSKTQYDFAVQPHNGTAKDGSHNFIHVSDTEIRERQGHQPWLKDLKSYAQNNNSAFIIHTGDICYPEGLEAHIQIMNTQNMDCPVFYTIGNHDLVKGEYGEQLYESIYGPSWYSFDVGGVHYIVTPMPGGDYAPKYTKEDVYEWLKNDLAAIEEGTPIYLFNHDLIGRNPDKLEYSAGKDKTIDLHQHNIKAWLYGHWHTNHMFRHGDAYSICTSTPIRGGIDHSVGAFRVMNVDANGDFRSQMRYPYLNSMEIASIHEGRSSVVDGKGTLSVNIYKSASLVESVTYTLKINDKASKFSGSLKPNTDWNFSGELDLSSLNEGDVVGVEVTARFKNGETSREYDNFTIETSPAVKLGENWTNLLKTSSHYGVASDSLGANLSMAWTTNTGSNIFMCSPLIYDGMVFTATIDENHQGKSAIVAMDATSGKILWKYPTKNSVKNTIVIESGNVMAQDVDGNLYAINAKTGTLSWEHKLGVASVIPILLEGLASNEGVVYAGTGKGLTALEAQSGKVLWVNKDWGQNESASSTISTDGGVVVLGSQWGSLYGNDAQTGKMLWRQSQNGLSSRGSSPVFYDGLLYLVSASNLFIIEPSSGEIVLRKELPYSADVTSTPLITEGEIIFGTVRDGLVALDRNTYEQKWIFRTGEAMLYSAPYATTPAAMIESSPVLSGGMVYIGGLDGVLYVLDAEKGTMLWKQPLGAPIFSSVAISGNALYVSDYAGNTSCFVGE